MEPLTDQQWTDLFGACQDSAWHLETRDWYGVDDEKQRFARFLATGRRDHAMEAAERQHWLDLMRSVTAAGVQVRRARIISEPASDYIRFSHAGAQPNIDAGEQIRWLARHRASRIALPGNDFWLFDRERVLFNYFTGDGRSAGHELATDAQAVRLCESAFAAVWPLAIPHAQYQIA
jgi:Family of unknown function (DUF6879)